MVAAWVHYRDIAKAFDSARSGLSRQRNPLWQGSRKEQTSFPLAVPSPSEPVEPNHEAMMGLCNQEENTKLTALAPDIVIESCQNEGYGRVSTLN